MGRMVTLAVSEDGLTPESTVGAAGWVLGVSEPRCVRWMCVLRASASGLRSDRSSSRCPRGRIGPDPIREGPQAFVALMTFVSTTSTRDDAKAIGSQAPVCPTTVQGLTPTVGRVVTTVYGRRYRPSASPDPSAGAALIAKVGAAATDRR